MPEEKPKAVYCPNCQGPATRTGNEITCETCDATFTITKKDGAKVKKLGPIQDHEDRLKKIEAKIFVDEPEPQEQPAGGDDEPDPENPGTDQDPENTDEDILPR